MVWIDVTIKKCSCRYFRPAGNCSFSTSGGGGGWGGGWGWHLQSLLRLLGKLAAFYTNPPFHHSVLTDHRWFQPF